MGLDMYLIAEKYISGFPDRPDPEYAPIVKAVGIEPTSANPAVNIRAYVGYWRKANAIHAWMCRNLQNDANNCVDVGIDREDLKKLRDVCQRVILASVLGPGRVHVSTTYSNEGKTEEWEDGLVIVDPSVAKELLPTQSGFFFGSTAYDEEYLDDLKKTVEICDRVLNDPALEMTDLYYRASW